MFEMLSKPKLRRDLLQAAAHVADFYEGVAADCCRKITETNTCIWGLTRSCPHNLIGTYF